MATRDRLKKMATQNPEMWSLYTKQRKRVTKEIRNSIQDHYKNLINESNGDPKKMWKTINRVLDKDVKSTNLSAIESEGKTLTKEHDMLEALNRHFVSVGPYLAKQISSKSDDDCLKHIIPENREMLFQTVDEEYVLNAINRLEKGKASGPDKVTITLVKDAASSIAYPLMLIYNASLMNGIFPDIWKLVRVTPIYKSGPKSDTNNYHRPISVISVFSRMLERLTHDQLFEFLKTNKRLTSNQAAFCKHYSTITSLIGSTDYWYESIDHSKVNLTVLGPLLFLIYINDLPTASKKLTFYLFADDTNIYYESKDLSNLVKIVNKELRSVKKWLDANKLSLNIDKTNYIIFHSSSVKVPSDSDIKIGKKHIKRVKFVKFLGLLLDEHLSWRYHLSELSKKLSRTCGMFFKIRNLLPLDVLVCLYNALFLSFLQYGLIVWGQTYASYTDPVFKKLLKLSEIFELRLLTFVFDSVNKTSPSCFHDFFLFSSSVHQYYTRHASQGDLYMSRKNSLQYGLKSIRYLGAKLWNTLPVEIRNAPSKISFKTRLKIHLLEKVNR